MAPVASSASVQGNQLSSRLTPAANSQANCKNLLAGGLARGVVFSVLALAVAPFILTAPVYATDDNTIDIAVDSDATMERSGDLYKATTSVTVGTDKPYGFSLTMQASTPDLINAADPTHKISAPQSATPVALSANQWGYALDKSATTFNAVPAGAQATPVSAQPGTQPVALPATSAASAVIADVTKAKPAGCKNVKFCTKRVTFAANVAQDRLAAGAYSTTITYTATAKPGTEGGYPDNHGFGYSKDTVIDTWKNRDFNINPSKVCQSGNTSSSCIVHFDPNMIPVKYVDGKWVSIASPEDTAHKGEWYDYSQKQLANTVTVKKEALVKYQGQSKPVNQADILGFWVYVPRYTYEVAHRDDLDDKGISSISDIRFETARTPKKWPAECKREGVNDYRTQCGISRELPLNGGNNSTWATHPAFSFGRRELNGFWVSKFVMTGTEQLPTVLPGEYDLTSSTIGVLYSTAKLFGIRDSSNVGGSGSIVDGNLHNLKLFNSRMINNKDWGAIDYLLGGGQPNTSYFCSNGSGHSRAGYGPTKSNNEHTREWARYGYTDGYDGCMSTFNPYKTDFTDEVYPSERTYDTKVGMLASNTGNISGIYDLTGGSGNAVAAGYSFTRHTMPGSGFNIAATAPYVNLYNFNTFKMCTYESCGGQALHEIMDCGDGGYDKDCSKWGNEFVYKGPGSWFIRGGNAVGEYNMCTLYEYRCWGMSTANSGTLNGSDRKNPRAIHVVIGPFSQSDK